MQGMLDIPEGFQVPVKNEGEMFTVPVEFTIMGGKLVPVAIDGIDLPAPEEEGSEEEGEEMEEEYSDSEGKMCPECEQSEGECECDSEGMGKGAGKGQGGFMVAVEAAMGKGKGGR